MKNKIWHVGGIERHGKNMEINDPLSQAKAIESKLKQIQQALEMRPRVSIRLRVGLVFGILFTLMSAITVASVVLLERLRCKMVFLEKVGSVEFDVQQARRYEKNFFLYGTNLQEALDNVSKAQKQLRDGSGEIAQVIGQQQVKALLVDIEKYQQALERLYENPASGPGRKKLENTLRRLGSQMVVMVENAREKERLAAFGLLQQSKTFALTFLGFMVVALVVFAGFITQAVLRPLGRFLRYANRIAAGDMSFIRPARNYRDEFSNLAMAFNRMLYELLQRHEQLVQSEKMAVVGKLTAGIAHELNNPLNNISLSVDSLLEDFEAMEPAKVKHILEQIAKQVDRASGTVSNLLDFTRKERQAFAKVDLNDIIRSALRLVENELKLAGIEVRTQLQDDLPPVRGNPRGLEQVFLNLFLNAIQAMGKGGLLEVKTAAMDCMVVATVKDTGPGMPEEIKKRIFEPFFTTKDPGQGTGLGLSVSLGIIDKHGGRIEADSKPGKGTTFTVFLPALQEEGKKG
ncbi:MAG: HAMP domain-containing protein [Deltaproteobacteria bacterium]|nr:MAG: HAMP domain-containing protein [Deltaproteobacteria bacterium]